MVAQAWWAVGLYAVMSPKLDQWIPFPEAGGGLRMWPIRNIAATQQWFQSIDLKGSLRY
jgi:hypothetical protein